MMMRRGIVVVAGVLFTGGLSSLPAALDDFRPLPLEPQSKRSMSDHACPHALSCCAAGSEDNASTPYFKLHLSEWSNAASSQFGIILRSIYFL